MTIKYEIEERTAPSALLVKLIHVESKTFSIFNIREWLQGIRSFAEELSELQEKLAEADFNDMRKAYDEYRKGRSTSSRIIGIAVADLVHAMDVLPDAQQVVIDLPPIEDVWHRKTYKTGNANVFAPEGTLYEPSKYITSEAGNRLALQLQDVAEDLQSILSESNLGKQLLELNSKPERAYGIDTATGRIAEIDTSGQVVLGERGTGLTDADVSKILGSAAVEYKDGGIIGHPFAPDHNNDTHAQADAENWDLLQYDKETKTISNWGSIRELSLESFYGLLDRIDQQVSLSHGKASTQQKSAAAKNSKNPRFWAHRAEDRVNGILVQARLNLSSDDPTRQLLEAVSEMFSDHIHGLGE